MTESSVIVAGFIPLLDCAPLVVAAEKGFAAAEGIELILARETSWANIRDRLVVGRLDAAHLLGPMAVAATLGIGHLQVPIIAPYSLGLGGNAITVAHALWARMVDAGADLGATPEVQGRALRQVVRERQLAGAPALTFAMVYPFSCHNYELRYWLAAVGIDPDRDVRLVVLPPSLLVDAMRAEHIDGFCVGEPWNSLAVAGGVGCIVLPTTAIWRLSPEKVLGCRQDWAQRHPEQLAALLRAVYRAGLWCDQPDNHGELTQLLSEPRFVGAPAAMLMHGLSNQLVLAPGGGPRPTANFYVLARHAATFPWVSHALWFYTQMVRWRQIEHQVGHLDTVRGVYRPDLYRAALADSNGVIPAADTKVEGAAAVGAADGFFDDNGFDAEQLAHDSRHFS
jgi:NitT/TauT family transport system ATP-binding protein